MAKAKAPVARKPRPVVSAATFKGAGKPLTQVQLRQTAALLGVELPALWAVMTVETKGCGFLMDRRPQILFERHVFRTRTGGKFDRAHPDLSNRVAGGYGATGANQYDRLVRAIALNRAAALESTSWGLGQVMGFNAVSTGFADVEAMVSAMSDSEDAQFGAMIAFINETDIAGYLKQGDWRSFAAAYNGPAFKKNQYDTKLSQASARFKVGPLPSVDIRAAQLYLTYLGYATGGVDGWFGKQTQNALIKFQKGKQAQQTGELDEQTLAALRQAASIA